MFSKFKKSNTERQQLVIPNQMADAQDVATQLRTTSEPRLSNNTLRIEDQDINNIVQVIFNPLIEKLLAHPLFIMSIVTQLPKNQELVNQIVKLCLESLESKYDITPTQVYKDKIRDSENTLQELNQNIVKRSEEFANFREQIIDFQNSSVQAYVKTMEDATRQLLDKIKL